MIHRNKRAGFFLILLILLTAFSAHSFAQSKTPQPPTAGISLQKSNVARISIPQIKNVKDFEGVLKTSLQNMNEKITLNFQNYDSKTYDLDKAINNIISTNYDIYYVKQWTASYDKKTKQLSINLRYRFTKKQVEDMNRKTASKVNVVVKALLKAGMSDYDKVKSLHDYLIDNCSYETGKLPGAEAYTAFGVLVGGRGTHEGYARAIQALLSKVGIESLVVLGNRSWNIVKVGGAYYHLDTAANAIGFERYGEAGRYDFFNINDSEMVKHSTWNRSRYPKCSRDTYNYFVYNKWVVRSEVELKNKLKELVENGINTAVIKLLDTAQKHDADALLQAIADEDPKLWYIRTWLLRHGSSTLMVELIYAIPRESIGPSIAEMQNKADQILRRVIKPGMSEFDKELALFDYVMTNTKLDASLPYDAETQSSYAALLKGRGNKEGFAKAFKLLLDKAGLQSQLVKSEGDIWNLVRVEEEYYHVNLALCIVDYRNKQRYDYRYFNLNDAAARAGSMYWDRSKYAPCTSDKYAYLWSVTDQVRVGDWIYYSNQEDNNRIYRVKPDGTEKSKVSNDRSFFLNHYDTYILFSNYSRGGRIYRISLDGSHSVVLNSEHSTYLYIQGSWIYYYNESDRGRIYRIQMNGDEWGSIEGITRVDNNEELIKALKSGLEFQITDNKLKEAYEKAVDIVAKLIKPDMTDFQKQLILHDYIVNNARYDKENEIKDTVPEDSHQAYGVLIKGVGVCDGYSKAMQILLRLSGIDSYLLLAENVDKTKPGHAWLIVKIDGEHYHLDITWNDPYSPEGDFLTYDYFNLTDEDIKKDHSMYTWDESLYPKCTATKYNYHAYYNLIANNTSEYHSRIVSAISSRSRELTVRLPNYDSGVYDVRSTVRGIVTENPSLPSVSAFSWVVNDKQGIVSIQFNYR